MSEHNLATKLAIEAAPSPAQIPDFSEWSEAVRVIETSIEAVATDE